MIQEVDQYGGDQKQDEMLDMALEQDEENLSFPRL